LAGIPGLFIYQYDILISALTEELCIERLDLVLGKLNSYNVQCQESKCRFLVPSVEYLGFLLDKDGLHPLPERVSAMKNVKIPTDADQLRCSLGILNFYNKFLPEFSTIAAPLNALLCKRQKWTWNKTQQSAFDKLPELLIHNSVLIPYSLDLPLRLTCDASPVEISSILSHGLDTGDEKPIAYASKSLSSSKRNYAQIEREGPAIVFGLKKFAKYLHGREFEIITNNVGIATIFSPSHTKSALGIGIIQRWSLVLLQYQFKIRHRNGQLIPHADSLSRLPSRIQETFEAEENNISFLSFSPLHVSDIREHTKKDPILSKVLVYIQHGWPKDVTDATALPYKRKDLELSIDNGCIMWGTRVIIPEKL
jgi:hypothetical protein